MLTKEFSAVVRAVATVVREYVAHSLTGIESRLKDLEVRAPLPGPKGEKGDPGEPTDLDLLTRGLAPVIQEHVTKATAELAAQIVVLEATIKALEARPIAKDGAPGPQGEAGPQGAAGEIGPIGPAGAQGEAGERGPEGAQGPVGPPGPSGDKGLDGTPGRDGRDGQPGLPGVMGEKGIDGANGRDGIDGKDGLGFDDWDAEYDGERTITLKVQNRDRIKTKSFRMPVVIYRGLYDASKSYEAGDAVTWGGSMWVAREDSHSIAPDENLAASKKAWALSVMRGRQGKQGTKGDPGLDGKRGPQGERGPSGY